MKHQILILSLFLSLVYTYGQEELYMSKEIKRAYGNGTRSEDGEPGKNYFQNSADYDINIEFNPINGHLTGNETVSYKNNSSTPLKKIVFRLYQNLYKKGVARNVDIVADDVNSGIEITEIICNENEIVNTDIRGTIMIVSLTHELKTGSSIDFKISWNYNFPMETQLREGRYFDSSYVVAYWYPRIAVYDDIYGWDKHKYNGEQEFYNDYGNYQVSIAVPKNYLVWASGELQNPNDNYSEFVSEKLEQAYQEDEIVNIITKKNIDKQTFTKQRPYNVWKFSSEKLSDFAFALSNNFLWDATSIEIGDKRIKVNAVYNPNSVDFHEVAYLSAQSLKHLSEDVMGVNYPYPQLTAFNGHYGMEFPMMINDGDGENRNETVFITAHEIGHSWFPFLVGTNETQYAWMDEGLITFLPKQVEDSLSDNEDFRSLSGTLKSYSYFGGSKYDVPIMAPSTQLTGPTYMFVSYNRSAVAYYVLKDILGEKTFQKCITSFIERWTGKHPTAYDFFYTFNNVSRENLNWFWNTWFFSFGYADLAITGFEQNDSNVTIEIKNKGGFPTPVYLKLFYSDDNYDTFYENASVWENDKMDLSVSFKTDKEVIRVEIDNLFTPDANDSNNIISKK